jgi:hypothetical protein
MKQSWKLFAVPVAVLGVASPMMTSCNALNEIAKDPSKLAEAAEGCPEFEKGDFSGIQLDAKLRGLLEASAKFDKVAAEMEVGVIQSCAELGKALKMKDDELKAEAKDGDGAKKVCGAVAAKLDTWMKANVEAGISVTITPPKCYADIDTMTKCFEECGSPVSPASSRRRARVARSPASAAASARALARSSRAPRAARARAPEAAPASATSASRASAAATARASATARTRRASAPASARAPATRKPRVAAAVSARALAARAARSKRRRRAAAVAARQLRRGVQGAELLGRVQAAEGQHRVPGLLRREGPGEPQV